MQFDPSRIANSAVQYFLPAHKAYIDKFYANKPDTSLVYANKSGEKRQVVKIVYPFGITTELTVEFPQDDGTTRYYTPLATNKGEDKDFIISYTDVASGEMFSCSGKDWQKWLGKEFSTEALPEPEMDEATKRQIENIPAVVAMHKKSENYNELVAQGWASATNMKENLGGFSAKKK